MWYKFYKIMFSYGQWYLAFSRVGNAKNLYIHSTNYKMENVVYNIIFLLSIKQSENKIMWESEFSCTKLKIWWNLYIQATWSKTNNITYKHNNYHIKYAFFNKLIILSVISHKEPGHTASTKNIVNIQHFICNTNVL